MSSSNSLVGGSNGMNVGDKGVIALPNGNYVVSSPGWDDGPTLDVGAVTYCSGTTGCTGPVTTSNSLHGTTGSDGVGSTGATVLSNGNYVVASPMWDNGAVANAGAVTFCSGTTGCTGPVTTTNSLHGAVGNDQVGSTVTALTGNGNYMVGSSVWNNGAAIDAGAATWCNGTTGCTGPVTTSNSLHGTTNNDNVGAGLVALSDGDVVVRSNNWDNGSTANVGAVTWCSGTTGCTGPVTTTNSLHGTTGGDQVGSLVTALTGNGNFVVVSSNWDNGSTVNVGAVTWCEGTASCNGPVSTSNSLYGNAASTQAGSGLVTAMPDGDFMFASDLWNSGTGGLTGGVTWGEGSTAGPRTVGPLSTSNTVAGLSSTVRVGPNPPILDSPRGKVLVPNHWICTCDRILVITLGTVSTTSSTTQPSTTTTIAQSSNTASTTTSVTQSVGAGGSTTTVAVAAPSTSTVPALAATQQSPSPEANAATTGTLPATGSSLPVWSISMILVGALIASRRRLLRQD